MRNRFNSIYTNGFIPIDVNDIRNIFYAIERVWPEKEREVDNHLPFCIYCGRQQFSERLEFSCHYCKRFNEPPVDQIHFLKPYTYTS